MVISNSCGYFTRDVRASVPLWTVAVPKWAWRSPRNWKCSELNWHSFRSEQMWESATAFIIYGPKQCQKDLKKYTTLIMKGKHGNYVIMSKCNDIFIISIFVANLSNRIEPRGRRKDDMTWGHFRVTDLCLGENTLVDSPMTVFTFGCGYLPGWHESLQWRNNERDGVSNHRRLDCLLNCLFRRVS